MRSIPRLLGALVALGCRAGDPSPAAATPASAARANDDPDAGPLTPVLLVEAPLAGPDEIVALRFTPDGRWLLALDGTIGVWELDTATPSLRERGWFGLAVDRGQPDIGPISAENAWAVKEQIDAWKQTHASIDDFEIVPGDRLVACADDGSLSVWQLRLGQDPPAVKRSSQPGVGKHCYGVAASADGRWVASFGRPDDAELRAQPDLDLAKTWQGVVALWAIDDDGNVRRTATAVLEDRPGEGVFTPDGRHLVVIGSSQQLVAFALDGNGGATLLPERRLDDTAEDIALVPGTDTVLLGGFDQQITRWQLDAADATLRFQRGYHHHAAKVRDVVPAPDGRFFVASSPDKTISLWPLQIPADRVPVPVTFQPSDDYVYGIDLHPHGPYLATAGSELRIWRLNRELLAAGDRTTKSVVVGRWSNTAAKRAIAEVAWDSESTLRTRDVEDGTRLWTIAGTDLVAGTETPGPRELDRRGLPFVARTGACRVGMGSPDGITTWRMDAGAPTLVGEFESDLGQPSLVVLAPDGTHLLLASQSRGLLWLGFDATTCAPTSSRAPIAIPPTPSGNVLSSVSYPGGGGAAPRSAGFSSDGRWLATGDGDSAGAVLWRIDPQTGPVHVGHLLGHTAGVGAIAFAPDGRHVVTAGRDGEVIVHRVDGARDPVVVERIEYLDPPELPGYFSLAAAWSPAGTRVAVVGGWGPHGRAWVFELALPR